MAAFPEQNTADSLTCNTEEEEFNIDTFLDLLGLEHGTDAVGGSGLGAELSTTTMGSTQQVSEEHYHYPGGGDITLEQNIHSLGVTPVPPTSTPQPLHLPQNSNYFDVEDLILGGALNTLKTDPTQLFPGTAEADNPILDSDGYSGSESDQEWTQERGKNFVTPERKPGSLITTASGHKRGPLNGGCFFPNKRPLPDLIPDFRPKSYTGAAAVAKGHQSATNTQGKKIVYKVYNTIPEVFPQFSYRYGFKYDNRGRLAPDVLFDRGNFARFIKYHPLGKNLWFRLEKYPANCKGFGIFTSDHPTYNLCRARDCKSKEKGSRGFHDGTIRVAIEEVLGRLPRGDRFENNPYFCAGYIHIDCLENLMDIGQLVRAGMLRPKPREFHPKEPNTSKTEPQVLCPPSKLVTCFEEFCKRVLQLQWDGYLHNLADRLQTYVWLSVQKKGKMTVYDAPSDMRKEDALELLKRRPVDPNWGGGRRPGLAMKTVKKAEAAGKRSQLVGPGTGRNSEKALKTAEKILYEIEETIPDSAYENGESWLKDCYIPIANPELYEVDALETPTPTSSTSLQPRTPQPRTRPSAGKKTTRTPVGISKNRAKPSPRHKRPFILDLYKGTGDESALTLADGSSHIHASDGTALTLKRPAFLSNQGQSLQIPSLETLSPNQSAQMDFPGTQSHFTDFSTPQLFYPPVPFLTPSSQQLLYPPIQSPIAMDFQRGSPQPYNTPPHKFDLSQDFGFDLVDNIAQEQSWEGTIDPQLLDLNAGDEGGTTDFMSAIITGAAPLDTEQMDDFVP